MKQAAPARPSTRLEAMFRPGSARRSAEMRGRAGVVRPGGLTKPAAGPKGFPAADENGFNAAANSGLRGPDHNGPRGL